MRVFKQVTVLSLSLSYCVKEPLLVSIESQLLSHRSDLVNEPQRRGKCTNVWIMRTIIDNDIQNKVRVEFHFELRSKVSAALYHMTNGNRIQKDVWKNHKNIAFAIVTDIMRIYVMAGLHNWNRIRIPIRIQRGYPTATFVLCQNFTLPRDRFRFQS